MPGIRDRLHAGGLGRFTDQTLGSFTLGAVLDQLATAQVHPHRLQPGLEQRPPVVGADVGGDLALAGGALADHPLRHLQHGSRVGCALTPGPSVTTGPPVTTVPTGDVLATTSWDKTAKLWDAASGKFIGSFDHQGWIWRAAFSPDGSRILTASADHSAKLWDAATGKVVWRFRTVALKGEAGGDSWV